MYGYKKLRLRIIELYGTMKDFHEQCYDKLGISYTAMSNKMRGDANFNQPDIEIWCELLDISKEEIGEYFFT